MKLTNQKASELIGKNNEQAKKAAEDIINNQDKEAWECLLENSDALFSYIKDKAGQRLISAINKSNLEKTFALMKKHDGDWDDYIAEALSRFESDELNAKMLEILQNGIVEEQTYAARYFCYVKHENAAEALFKASKGYYLPLRNNAAEALGKLNHKESYYYYIEELKSGDDWEKIEAAQFLAGYGNKEAVPAILEAMSNSNMAELIAGEIAMLTDIHSLFTERSEHTRLLALEALDNIISGIPEVWPMGVLLDFKIFECVETLIEMAKKDNEDELVGKYAQILLKTRQKTSLFLENNQYTYDEEKDILAELDEIHHLLIYENEEFWQTQLKNLYKELVSGDYRRKISAIAILNELEEQESIPYLIKIVNNREENDSVICEAASLIAKRGKIDLIDTQTIVERIKDPNLKAYIADKL